MSPHMDLARVKNADKLDLCRKYYLGVVHVHYTFVALVGGIYEDLFTHGKSYFPRAEPDKRGFAFLPFLWFINSVWFFKEAFIKSQFEQQRQIRSYVIRSMIGTLIWATIITIWVVIFQTNRVAWGITADKMSFIIPRGTP